MKYNTIKGVEINPELTVNNPGYIYINEGTFEYEKGIAKFEFSAIKYDCSVWNEGATRINVYYNPDLNKIHLDSENIETPNSTYGYHLGGITLKEPGATGFCLDQILLPFNPDITHIKFFNYEYDESFYHLYHFERPEYIFNPGFDDGFDQIVDEPNTGPNNTPTDSIWDSLL